jgi:hypothetical protein
MRAMPKSEPGRPAKSPRRRKLLPRSFKDLTPSRHFSPGTFFYELVWKALLTRRTGENVRPKFPKLARGQAALTWIGHASFLAQFTDLNVLIDPNFANWLFLLKRIRRAGLKIQDLPRIDVVLLTHAHFDHFHRPTLRRLKSPEIAIVPWGVGDLARNLGFGRIIELQWWESFSHHGWKVTFTPAKHWGARVLRDDHRGYGGFLIEHQGGCITRETAPISADSGRSAKPTRRKWRCCRSGPIIQSRSVMFIWGRMKRSRPSAIFTRNGWCRCTMGASDFRLKTWMSRRAGFGNWPRRKG